MHQAVILIAGIGGDAFAMEASEERSGAGSVETFVVIKDANAQNLPPLCAGKPNNRNCLASRQRLLVSRRALFSSVFRPVRLFVCEQSVSLLNRHAAR